MNLVINNPYRIIGLLVGATAREQERQVRRLRQLVEAEQEPENDFSFPVLGHLQRTIDSVSDAASKLNLDSDKITAALFWFYNGNAITDEVALEAIKDGDTDKAMEIWRKLAYDSEGETYNEITKRNASAFHNLSTLYLEEYGIDEDTLQLKLRYLESDFFNELKGKSTDETYKISNKEIQLLFLNSLIQEENFDTSEFIEAISKIDFLAKDDFLKDFTVKPIELIEKKIEENKGKRKANKANSINLGKALFEQTSETLKQLKSILGQTNPKLSSISDKVSDEILQCGIDYFSHYKDSSTDPGSASMDLFRKAKTLAIGTIAKQRCQENTENLQEWIDSAPDRNKLKIIKEELDFIGLQLENLENLTVTVENAISFINACKPKIIKIRQALSSSDELYLNISSAVVQNAQNMLVEAVNKKVEKTTNSLLYKYGFSSTGDFRNIELEVIITFALEATFSLGGFGMHPNLRNHYTSNLDGLKSLARQLNISTLSPIEKIHKELANQESELKKIQSKIYFESEIIEAQQELSRLQEWQFLRSPSERETQIYNQNEHIAELIEKSEHEKAKQIKKQQKLIKDIKIKIQQFQD
jgi:hypothetical protein